MKSIKRIAKITRIYMINGAILTFAVDVIIYLKIMRKIR